MKIAFFGTPELARTALKSIHDAGYEVCLVVTRADKPKGRGNKIAFSPVKEYAIEKNIQVFQPISLKTPEVFDFLKQQNADIFITAAYGRIFPKEILNIPPMGCINIHASLLPFWRGASPINRALMNGDSEGGVTIMCMDEGVDTGDILLQLKTKISPDLYFDEYYKLVSELGANAILKVLHDFQTGIVTRTKQNSLISTHADKIEKSDELISFDYDAATVFNKIRALSPEPCAYTFLNEKRIKIFKACVLDGSGEPGKILKTDKNGIEIACKSKSILITELQPENKSRMSAQAFLAGNKIMT